MSTTSSLYPGTSMSNTSSSSSSSPSYNPSSYSFDMSASSKYEPSPYNGGVSYDPSMYGGYPTTTTTSSFSSSSSTTTSSSSTNPSSSTSSSKYDPPSGYPQSSFSKYDQPNYYDNSSYSTPIPGTPSYNSSTTSTYDNYGAPSSINTSYNHFSEYNFGTNIIKKAKKVNSVQDYTANHSQSKYDVPFSTFSSFGDNFSNYYSMSPSAVTY
ncbi:hypothetical protein PIROE2DRAFT_67197 [Piromyces sp. E2]|nr:hypothetical protein PIROE2DRAFT_67197 [Piromyces sp. E2]|eukprot:OUM65464.1 hypothetical protein PIROE2DRAFT_67197 [Piromyces sp. E2]